MERSSGIGMLPQFAHSLLQRECKYTCKLSRKLEYYIGGVHVVSLIVDICFKSFNYCPNKLPLLLKSFNYCQTNSLDVITSKNYAYSSDILILFDTFSGENGYLYRRIRSGNNAHNVLLQYNPISS